MKSIDIELAVARFFNWRQNIIVNNISWGMFNHECDMIILTPSGYCYEVEIKVSLSDLKRDKLKNHNHESGKIKALYFAIPEKLVKHSEHIPERAGILQIGNIESKYLDYHKCDCIKDPVYNKPYKMTDAERYQIARLGTMRIWNLKRKIIQLQNKK